MARRISWSIILSLLMVMSACGDADEAGQQTTATAAITTSSTIPVSTTSTPPEDPVVWPTDGWPTATPESQGISSDALARMVERFALLGGVDSVTVIRNGYVVVDAVFHPFPADAGHNLYSVTKSFVGTLIGIAIDRGLLAGIDVPVVEILTDAAPDEVDERKAAMTVEDLLTMSAGLECRDSDAYNFEGLEALAESDDWTAHVLSLPMAEEPGVRFEYCNQASHLLSAILTEVTGLPASEFAEEVLFTPLGITDFEWPAGPNGITLGFSDLVLEPKDMAKLGYLYLHHGMWEGEQLISRNWVEAAIAEQIDVPFVPDAYGYQWWVYPPLGYAMAQGHGGQYIVVDAAHEMLVVITASEAFFSASGVTNELVLAAVEADRPLDPNPAGEARLLEAVSLAADGPQPIEVELPEMAATISGVRYEFRPNDLGFDSFVLEFSNDGAVLDWTDDVEQGRFDVGLDGRFAVNDGEAPLALRGKWFGDSSFAVSVQTIGLADPATLHFRFLDDRVHLWLSTPEMNETIIADRVG